MKPIAACQVNSTASVLAFGNFTLPPRSTTALASASTTSHNDPADFSFSDQSPDPHSQPCRPLPHSGALFQSGATVSPPTPAHWKDPSRLLRLASQVRNTRTVAGLAGFARRVAVFFLAGCLALVFIEYQRLKVVPAAVASASTLPSVGFGGLRRNSWRTASAAADSKQQTALKAAKATAQEVNCHGASKVKNQNARARKPQARKRKCAQNERQRDAEMRSSHRPGRSAAMITKHGETATRRAIVLSMV